MKLLFDASILGYSLLNSQYRTGIYQVALALLRHLAERPGLEVLVYSSSGNQLLVRRVLRQEGIGLPVVGRRWWSLLAFGVLLARNVVHRQGFVKPARGFTRVLALVNRVRFRADRTLLKSADWYFSPMEAAPEGVRRAGVRVAVLVHDLIPLVLPEYRQDPTDPTRWFPRLFASLRVEDLLFTVSAFTREDLLKRCAFLQPERVITAPNAYETARFFPDVSVSPQLRFFTLSTIEPRKRIDTIVRAFQRYREQGGRAEMVIGGANRQNHQEAILGQFSADVRSHVRFTGYLADEELPGLYRSCLGFVYVSEYEGFGLPVLEAMACGAPVAVSNRTSLPEVVGPQGLQVSPDDPEALAAILLRWERDADWRKEQADASLARARMFSWGRTSGIIEDALRAFR